MGERGRGRKRGGEGDSEEERDNNNKQDTLWPRVLCLTTCESRTPH